MLVAAQIILAVHPCPLQSAEHTPEDTSGVNGEHVLKPRGSRHATPSAAQVYSSGLWNVL